VRERPWSPTMAMSPACCSAGRPHAAHGLLEIAPAPRSRAHICTALSLPTEPGPHTRTHLGLPFQVASSPPPSTLAGSRPAPSACTGKCVLHFFQVCVAAASRAGPAHGRASVRACLPACVPDLTHSACH